MTPEQLSQVMDQQTLKWRNKDSFFVMSLCAMILISMVVVAVFKWIVKKYRNKHGTKVSRGIEWL